MLFAIHHSFQDINHMDFICQHWFVVYGSATVAAICIDACSIAQ